MRWHNSWLWDYQPLELWLPRNVGTEGRPCEDPHQPCWWTRPVMSADARAWGVDQSEMELWNRESGTTFLLKDTFPLKKVHDSKLWIHHFGSAALLMPTNITTIALHIQCLLTTSRLRRPKNIGHIFGWCTRFIILANAASASSFSGKSYVCLARISVLKREKKSAARKKERKSPLYSVMRHYASVLRLKCH